MNLLRQLYEEIKKLIAFVRSVLSERDGTGSACRTIGLIVAIGGVTALLLHIWIKRELPTADVLGGLAKVIGVGSAGYGANQVRAAFAPTPSAAPESDVPEPKGA